MKLQVLVVSQHKRFRSDLARYAESLDPCIEVIGESVNAMQALRSIEALQPGLVLLDLNLRPGKALDLTATIHRQWPATAVVVVGNEPAADYRGAAQEAGALEYVDVLELGAELPAALWLVDQLADCRKARERLIQPAPEDPRPQPLARLRARLRTAPTGPKHGPYSGWQYVHLCLALALAQVIYSLRDAAALPTGSYLLMLLALMGIAIVEVRQLARARYAAEAVGSR